MDGAQPSSEESEQALTAADPDGASVTPDVAAPAGGYSVLRNQIVDSLGRPHVFRGVDRPSLEWSSTGDSLSLADYQKMKQWGANIVRLGLCQDFAIPGAALYDPTYLSRVTTNVGWAKQAGLDVMLILHFADGGDLSITKSAPGYGCGGDGVHLARWFPMPDQNSKTFWQIIAGQFKNDPHVVFGLFPEPHTVDWSTWRNGGHVDWQGWDGRQFSYQAAGFQELYDVVRATGAQNVIFLGGLNFGFTLSGMAQPQSRVSGTNIAYNVDLYNHPGKITPADWQAAFGFLADTAPVTITEFGQMTMNGYSCANSDWMQQLIGYSEARGIGWMGWAWYPGGCEFPSLLQSFGPTWTPTAQGTQLKTQMSKVRQPRTAVGVFRAGQSFHVDTNRNGYDQGDFSAPLPGSKPVVGDWGGTGQRSLGVFRNATGHWVLDVNRNGADAADKVLQFGLSGDVPVVGDWTGDGKTKVGVFRAGTWYLDVDGNGYQPTDKVVTLGKAGDIPVVGDWNGDGKTDIGVWRNGTWELDLGLDGLDPSDKVLQFGLSGDVPVVGDWTGDGKTKVGVFRAGTWYLDVDGNGYQPTDRKILFGLSGDTPLVGSWDGSAVDRVGVWRSGHFYLDLDGGGYDGTDASLTFGLPGDVPIVIPW